MKLDSQTLAAITSQYLKEQDDRFARFMQPRVPRYDRVLLPFLNDKPLPVREGGPILSSCVVKYRQVIKFRK